MVGLIHSGYALTDRSVHTARSYPITVSVTAGANVKDNSTQRRREDHCQIDPDFYRQLKVSGILNIRNQLVVTIGTESVPFTVEILESQTSLLTVRLGTEGRARFPSATFPTTGTISAYLPSTGIDDAAAVTGGLYYETLDDNGSNTNTIVIAPHGGSIEANTTVLSAAMKVGLDGVGKTTTVWCGVGYGLGSQTASQRWHVGSVTIDERQLPMLESVYSRGFARCISIHGQSGTARIDLGCDSGENAFVDTLVTALQAHSDLSGVTIARTDNEAIAGSDAKNIGNRLSGHYVQVEATSDVRSSSTKRAAIVSVFATAYGAL